MDVLSRKKMKIVEDSPFSKKHKHLERAKIRTSSGHVISSFGLNFWIKLKVFTLICKLLTILLYTHDMLIASRRNYVKLIQSQICNGHRFTLPSVRYTSVNRLLTTSIQSHANKDNSAALSTGDSLSSEAALSAAPSHGSSDDLGEDAGIDTNAIKTTAIDGKPHSPGGSHKRYRRINLTNSSIQDSENIKKPSSRLGRQYLTSDLNKLTNTTLDFRQSDDTLKHRFIKSGRLGKSEIVERAIFDVKTLKANQKPESAQFVDPFLNYDASNLSDSSDAMDLAELFASLQKTPNPLQPKNEVQAREAKVTDALDIFDVTGLKGESMVSAEHTPSSQQNSTEKSRLSNQIPQVSRMRTEVDWKNLSLSPLIDNKYVAARNKFRTSKSKPSESINYDKARGRNMSKDYIAQMLASNVRTCRLTRMRLPVDFLTTTIVLAHPETGHLYEVPDGMAHKPSELPKGYVSEEEYVAAFVRQIEDSTIAGVPANQVPTETVSVQAPSKDNIQESEDLDIAQAKTKAENDQAKTVETEKIVDGVGKANTEERREGSAVTESENNLSSDMPAEETDLGDGTLEDTEVVNEITSITSMEETTKDSTSNPSGRRKSHILSTADIFRGLVKMKEKLYRRTLPLQWHPYIHTKGSVNFKRREDLDGFLYSLLQRQVTTELKNIRTLAWDKRIPRLGLCTTMDSSAARQFLLPDAFNHGTILYLGNVKDNVDMQPTFSSTVRTIAASRPEVTLLDDLFNKPEQSEALSHAVRLRSEDWDSLIAYDLTRMLEPAFLEAVQAAGYRLSAYWILPNQEFLQNLWSLAHYMAPNR